MSRSLQDQLLKAGVATQKQARKAKVERRKARKGQGGGPPAAATAEREQARRAQAEKVARDRELNQQRQEAARRRAASAGIRQMVESNRLPREGGETPYNFVDGATVRRLYVTAEQQKGLAAGRLSIVRAGDGYEVVPAAVAARIEARDPAAVLPPPRPDPPPDADDPYADHPVPDDLIW